MTETMASEARPPIPEAARPIENDFCVAVPFRFDVAMPETAPRIAAVCHVFYPDLTIEMQRYLSNIPVAFDTYVSTDTDEKRDLIAKLFRHWRHGQVDIRVVPNRGRDAAAKLVGFADVYQRYDYVVQLHSKRSPQTDILRHWRTFSFESLLGSSDIVRSFLYGFETTPRLGIIAAQHFEPVRHWINWGYDYELAERLAAGMDFSIPSETALDFPSGSMFWARSAALRPLVELGLTFEDFPEESGQRDGTPAHAIEHMIYHVAEHAGFDWIKTANPALFGQTPGIVEIDSDAALRRFLMEHRVRLLGPDAPRPRREKLKPISTPTDSFTRTVQRNVSGSGRAIRSAVAIGLLTHDNEPAQVSELLRSVDTALRRAAPPAHEFLVLDNGSPSAEATASFPRVKRLPTRGNVGFSAGHNRMMADAFRRGADVYVAINPDGVLHPAAIRSLLQMVEANLYGALVEAAQVPADDRKDYDPVDFSTEWVSGACLAIPRRIYEAIGGFDETFFLYCGDVDLSWRARAAGFQTKCCPQALFLHATTNRAPGPDQRVHLLSAAIELGRKWRAGEAFEDRCAKSLQSLGHLPPAEHPEPVPPSWTRVTNFDEALRFGRGRW